MACLQFAFQTAATFNAVNTGHHYIGDNQIRDIFHSFADTLRTICRFNDSIVCMK